MRRDNRWSWASVDLWDRVEKDPRVQELQRGLELVQANIEGLEWTKAVKEAYEAMEMDLCELYDEILSELADVEE